MAAETTADDIAYVIALVRASDRPRYYATLFAPAAARADLFSLYGFAAEIERVPDLVSEPALGEIRLRWWQDALAEAIAPGGTGSTPALRAIAGTIERHRLPLAPFNSLIEARATDFYSDPPAALADVEGRMGEMESVLFQMASIVLGAAAPETANAAGHAGIAYGLARRLATFASERARGRTIVSADLLARGGLAPADVFASSRAELRDVIAAMASFAREHLQLFRARTEDIPRAARYAFLPLAIVEPLLQRIERDPAIVTERVEISDLEALARIGWARLRGP